MEIKQSSIKLDEVNKALINITEPTILHYKNSDTNYNELTYLTDGAIEVKRNKSNGKCSVKYHSQHFIVLMFGSFVDGEDCFINVSRLAELVKAKRVVEIDVSNGKVSVTHTINQ